jgi:hypothetical protein
MSSRKLLMPGIHGEEGPRTPAPSVGTVLGTVLGNQTCSSIEYLGTLARVRCEACDASDGRAGFGGNFYVPVL